MTYDAEYYHEGNYVGYLDRRERYWRLAGDISMFLDSIALKSPEKPVLDFGCGPGFLVEGLQKAGHTDVWGYDISDWAIRYGRQMLGEVKGNGLSVSLDHTPRQLHLTTILDVLEHMDRGDIDKMLRGLNSNYILVRIPVATDDDGLFHLKSARKDPTHVSAFTKDKWRRTFAGASYREVCRLNLSNIWDSEGVLCALYRHENI